MRGEAGDDGRDHDADGRDHHDGDPDALQHLEPQRRAAVEQDVARAEQHDDLAQRGGGLDVDEAERMRSERDACDQEDRDVGNCDLLRDKGRQRADRKDQPAGEQGVLGDGDGARGFHHPVNSAPSAMSQFR